MLRGRRGAGAARNSYDGSFCGQSKLNPSWVSNPCFEIWLLLVAGETVSWCESRRAIADLDAAVPTGMLNRPDFWKEASIHAACRQAYRLDAIHAENGRAVPQNNPSTGVHEFIQMLGLWSPTTDPPRSVVGLQAVEHEGAAGLEDNLPLGAQLQRLGQLSVGRHVGTNRVESATWPNSLESKWR